MAGLPTAGTPVDFTKPIDYSTIKGRTALVTGGASGIGNGIVRALLEHGCRVVYIADCNLSAGLDAERDLSAAGFEVSFQVTDVTSWEDQVRIFEMAVEASPTKTIDIVVTSAGIKGSLADLPSIHFSRKPVKPSTKTIDTNLIGTYYSAVLALWYFARSQSHPSKQLLFISSLAAYNSPISRDLHIQGDYEASKFGVRGLFHQLHPRAVDYGCARINMICPSSVDTPLLQPGTTETASAAGIKTATVADVVCGAMRCICDREIKGRSVAIVSGSENGVNDGEANFDMKDEPVNVFGGKAFMGNLGKLFIQR